MSSTDCVLLTDLWWVSASKRNFVKIITVSAFHALPALNAVSHLISTDLKAAAYKTGGIDGRTARVKSATCWR